MLEIGGIDTGNDYYSLDGDVVFGGRIVTTCFLYVPGHRPDWFAGAISSGADAVIVDLEDAVPPDQKFAARSSVSIWLGEEAPTNVWVRINSDARERREDLAMLAGCCHAGVVVPKALPETCDVDRTQVIALVESAVGVLALGETARVEAVVQLAIGEQDLAAEFGLRDGWPSTTFAPIRSSIVVVSAASGLEPPCAPVFTGFEDLVGLRLAMAGASWEGFGCGAAIHPAQVEAISEAFLPSMVEIDRAREVVERVAASGSASFHGELVDEAMAKRAAGVLMAAKRSSGRMLN